MVKLKAPRFTAFSTFTPTAIVLPASTVYDGGSTRSVAGWTTKVGVGVAMTGVLVSVGEARTATRCRCERWVGVEVSVGVDVPVGVRA